MKKGDVLLLLGLGLGIAFIYINRKGVSSDVVSPPTQYLPELMRLT